MALLTTRGFRDVYELGRANRPDMYNVRYRQPTPLVPRRWVFEIDERVAADGSPLVVPDADAVRSLGRRLAADFDAVAICFLHSYANGDHEQLVAGLLGDVAPSLSVVCSHEIAPEWREYERTSTTVIAAYVAPIVERYLAELEQQVTDRGLRGPLRVMQSNGGVMAATTARRKAIQTLFSGPVGGTIACVAVADDLRGELDVDHLICVDMGGTSFDVSLVVDGQADVELESELERHPVLAPTVAIHTIGAGGGSVGHVAAGGLRVGPRSAGAEPGPACYGTGGAEPTVTDANLHLGRLPAIARLAGGMPLDPTAAAGALAAVGEQLGLDAAGLAVGLVAVADSAMANAIREITVLRGIDPRSFALVAFGGAASLHAAASLLMNQLLGAVEQGERDGYDAVVIACASDPGLADAKELVSIPVTAPLEAAIATGRALGRLGIVAPRIESGEEENLPQDANWVRRLVHAYGGESAFAGVFSAPCGHPPADLVDRLVVEDPLELRAAVRREMAESIAGPAGDAAESAWRDHDATVLFFACTLWSALLEPVRERVPVPVLDPLITPVRYAEMLAGAGRKF